jgi:hypothetical protein
MESRFISELRWNSQCHLFLQLIVGVATYGKPYNKYE